MVRVQISILRILILKRNTHVNEITRIVILLCISLLLSGVIAKAQREKNEIELHLAKNLS